MHLLVSMRGSPINSYLLLDYMKKIYMRHGNILIVFVIIVGAFSLGYFAGKGDTTRPLLASSTQRVENKSSEDRVDFGTFWVAWDLLKKKFVDSESLDPQELVYGAINGMFVATGDPYTVFLNPKKTQALNEELDGSFQGIGAEIGVKDNLLTVVAPLDNTPAQRAGIRSGDKIIEIDGVVAAELTIEEAVQHIRGEKGTDVVLKIFRDGDNDTRDITVTRDDIIIESVQFKGVEDDIAYIRIATFGVDTFTEFEEALARAESENMRGLVIDLRNNPGGLLEVASKMVGLFVPSGSVSLIEKDAAGKDQAHIARGTARYLKLPVVLLINEGSASASEIFAGALKDHRSEIQLVGQTSFGKGSVQELIPMKDGTAAKITVAKWFTPHEREIDQVGIAPDHEVEISSEDFEQGRDPQKDKGMDILHDIISPSTETGEEIGE